VRGKNTDEKNIFFSRPCKMASIVAVIGEGIIKKIFSTRKSGPPPDFLSVRKIEGFLNPGHIEN
jgi:hypothetical protein